MTVSALREVMARLFARRATTAERIAREINAVLRRKEEARIYHYVHGAGRYPPRRTAGEPHVADPPRGDPLQ